VYVVFDVIYTDQHQSVTRWPLHVGGAVGRAALMLGPPPVPPTAPWRCGSAALVCVAPRSTGALPDSACPLQERHGLLNAILPPPEGGVPVGRGFMRARVVTMLPGLELLDSTYFSKVRLGWAGVSWRLGWVAGWGGWW
jgi:hypothetical protein